MSDEARNKRTMHLIGALWRNGYTLKTWARANGYTYGAVKMIVFRHWGRNTAPRGEKTMEILHKLQKEVDGGNDQLCRED